MTWESLRRLMTSGLKRRLTLAVSCAALIIGAWTAAFAQQPSASPSPSPSVEATETARPLYGYQGIMVETLDGKIVSSQGENDQFNPASTLKLATALIALRTFGADHRFATGVWTDGVVDKTTGTLTGNLYVSGRDPSFHYEHAILLARELNN